MSNSLFLLLVPVLSWADFPSPPPLQAAAVPAAPAFSAPTSRGVENSFSRIRAALSGADETKIEMPALPSNVPPAPIFSENMRLTIDSAFARLAFSRPDQMSSVQMEDQPVAQTVAPFVEMKLEAEQIQLTPQTPPRPELAENAMPTSVLVPNEVVEGAIALQLEEASSHEEPSLFRQVHRRYQSLSSLMQMEQTQ